MCSNIFLKFSFQTYNIISRHINESQICLGLWYDVQTISKKNKVRRRDHLKNSFNV